MRAWLAAPLAAALIIAVAPAQAGQATNAKATIQARHAWLRVLPGPLPAAGYVTLANTGDKTRILTGASSADYGSVMLHQSTVSHGMSHMSAVHKLPIPAHGSVTLAPGGYHLMLMHAKTAVKPGDQVPVTLRFADGSTLKVRFKARPANAH